jgi:hypothetical protein
MLTQTDWLVWVKQSGRFGSIGLVFAVASCLVKSRDADEARWAEAERQHDERVRQERLKAQQEITQREAQRTQASQKQDACKREVEEEQQAAAARKETSGRQLPPERVPQSAADCPRSALPPGTYASSEDDALYLRVQVNAEGCASYEAFGHGTTTVTKTIQTVEGYHERTLKRDWSCTSSGILTAEGTSFPVTFVGNQCRAPGQTLTSEAHWSLRGGTIVVRDRWLQTPLRLARESVAVDLVDGLPSSWPQRAERSDDQERAAVAFSHETAAARVVDFNSLYEEPDWCQRLNESIGDDGRENH